MAAAKTVKPATLDNFAVLARPVYRCEMLPEGYAGVVQFNGAAYTVLPLGHDPRDGYRLTAVASGKVYDVDTSSGHPRCDCPDFVARRGRTGPKDVCKHCLALIRMRKDSVI